MKSHMYYQRLGSLPKENQAEKSINIMLNPGYVNTILDFLIMHDIPFSLSVAGEEVERNDLEVKPAETKGNSLTAIESIIMSKPSSSVDKKRKSLIDNIYQKYLTKGIDKVPPPIKEIAAEIGLSLSQFNALFKKHYGKPFYHIYVEHKMEHAAELLRKGYSAAVVSERIGYGHPIKFNKMFQKYFGVTPKKYQLSQKV